MNVEVLYTRFRTRFKTTVRLAGLVAVLLAVYHLFIPFFVVDPMTWTPWRVFGLWLVGERALMYLGDLLLLASGAIVTWFV